MSLYLYDHQLEALEQMKNGCILCGDVGSGKSLTALAYYYLKMGGKSQFLTGGTFYQMSAPKDLYIITTARKRDTKEWENELIHFLMSPNSDINQANNMIVVDSWNNIKKYKDVKDAFFIFDEQRVIGYGVWAKSFIAIAKNNSWILLTATPGDTWMDYMSVFIANGFYKNKTHFTVEHVVYSAFTNFPKVERYLNTKKLEYLKNKILIVMEYTHKTVSHHVDIFTEYDKQLYKSVFKNRWNPYKDEPIENISALCHTLRKIVYTDESRQTEIQKLVEKHKKVIIFYNFDYELEILRNIEYQKGTQIAEWNGHKHELIPKSNHWVYLVQYISGNEGWNCIETDTVIFYSQHYSYRVMKQASGRINRLNTPFVDLYYYYLKSKAPIDVAVSRAIRKKKKFNEKNFIKW